MAEEEEEKGAAMLLAIEAEGRGAGGAGLGGMGIMAARLLRLATLRVGTALHRPCGSSSFHPVCPMASSAVLLSRPTHPSSLSCSAS